MTFVSFEFLCLFASVFLIYFHLPPRHRNSLLLVASAIFYMWWRPEYIFIILCSVTIDYFVALGLEKGSSPIRRRRLLILSLVTNLGLLFFFKYYEFAAENLGVLLRVVRIPWTPPVLKVLLPIGISFHTFQALSYTIDVYRGEIPVERNLLRLWLYVLFFPQLVAGPIERAGRLLPQFDEVHPYDEDRVTSGLRLVLWGFVKKVAIADRLAQCVDPIFASPEDFAGYPLLLGIYGFAFQIYADFSGYSDIAVGTARILGFRLMDNFRQPYFSTSVADFWRRWHISLSTWFRDYVYIPLGGNRRGPVLGAVALLSTFVLSGLWHGARWTFVVWGAYHGMLILLSRSSSGWRAALARRMGAGSLSPWVRALVTFHLVSAGWVFFRARSLKDAGYLFSHLIDYPRLIPLELLRLSAWDLGGAAIGIGILLAADGLAAIRKEALTRWAMPTRWVAYVLGALAVLSGGVGTEVPFIYFRF